MFCCVALNLAYAIRFFWLLLGLILETQACSRLWRERQENGEILPFRRSIDLRDVHHSDVGGRRIRVSRFF
jgi:hypothetical protein